MNRVAVCATVVLAVVASTMSAVAAARDSHFQSPSGNINCRLEASWVDCLVKKDTWPTHRSRPASCEVDWFPAEISLAGQGLRVGSCRGDVGPLCLPQTGLTCSVLAYGRSVSNGLIRCVSAKNGVTCRRRDGRHVGFRIAREGYTLFR